MIQSEKNRGTVTADIEKLISRHQSTKNVFDSEVNLIRKLLIVVCAKALLKSFV